MSGETGKTGETTFFQPKWRHMEKQEKQKSRGETGETGKTIVFQPKWRHMEKQEKQKRGGETGETGESGESATQMERHGGTGSKSYRFS